MGMSRLNGFLRRRPQSQFFFSVGPILDADLEVAFREFSCFCKRSSGWNDFTNCFTKRKLGYGNRRLSHLTSISSPYSSKPPLINTQKLIRCCDSLPKLTYVKDQLCSSSCEMSKAKRSSFMTKISSSKGGLNLLHNGLCGTMRVASIEWEKYILVIVDDYSRYTWHLFMRSKVKHRSSQRLSTMIPTQSSSSSYYYTLLTEARSFLNKKSMLISKGRRPFETSNFHSRTPEQERRVE
ncbi:hypothetical protein Tco_0052621 [Tanacetum coccineum]